MPSYIQVLKVLEDSFKTLDVFGLGERDVDDVKDLLSDVSLKVCMYVCM